MKVSSPRLSCLVAAVCLLEATAPAQADAERNTTVVNTSGQPGVPVAERLRRLLDSRGALVDQSEEQEAALESQPVARADLEEVRKAFSDFRYQDTEVLLEALGDGLLASGSAGAKKPLAEVLWWRGLVAAVDDSQTPIEQRRKAKLFFTAAFTLDGNLTTDTAVTPPRVRLLIDEARRVQPEQGSLQLDADVGGAELSIDGGASAAIDDEGQEKIAVPTGLHLLRVSAPERGAVLRLVEITKGQALRLSVELPAEGKPDKIRRIVGEAASVPEGKPRMKVLSRLSGVVGVKRLLLVESVQAERAKIRLYDVGGKRMSQQFSFSQTDSSTAVGNAVDGAFRLSDGEATTERHWYTRWQVWAGVGAAVVAVVVIVSINQEPRVTGL